MNGGVPSKEFNGGLCDVSDQSPFTRRLRDILDHLASNGNSLGDLYDIHDIVTCLQIGADPNTKGKDGKTALYYLNKELSGILDELEQNIGVLSDYGCIQNIIRLLQVGADSNIKGKNGKTLSYYLSEELSGILDELKEGSTLLGDSTDLQYIVHLLQAGADPNIKDEDGKTLSDYSSKKLHNMLDRLAIDSDLLYKRDYLTKMCYLLQIRADPNIKGKDGKTALDHLNKELRDMLDHLASNVSLLGDRDFIQRMRSLLGLGANPNVQNQAGKTLLHYVAERNDIDGIRYFLGVVKANSSI